MVKRHYGDDYGDKFEEVMNYVELRLKNSGTRLKVRDKEDLRTLFERLDNNRQDKSKTKPRFTSTFIERAISTDKARARYGTVIGRFGNVKTLRREGSGKEAALRERLKSQGKASYRYNGGLAYKSTYKRGSKTVTNFRDASTGRFIKRNTPFQEE